MSAYDREKVGALVPTIWDRMYAWGMVNEYEPESGMPKTKGAKNTKNTLWAFLADIRRAWDGAPLTERQRQALVLCGGMGHSYVEAGKYLGLKRQVVQEHYDAGIGRMVVYLNGYDPADEFEHDTDD